MKDLKVIVGTKKIKNFDLRLELLLGQCSERERLEFVLHCNKGLGVYYSEEKNPGTYQVMRNCLDLVVDYLEEPSETKRVGLEQATNAAYVTATKPSIGACEAFGIYATSFAAQAVSSKAGDARAVDAAVKVAYATAYAAANSPGAFSGELYTTKLEELYEHLFSKLTEGINQSTLDILYGSE